MNKHTCHQFREPWPIVRPQRLNASRGRSAPRSVPAPPTPKADRRPSAPAPSGVALAALLVAVTLLTAPTGAAQAPRADGWVEISVLSERYSIPVSDGRAVALRAQFRTAPRHAWRVEALVEERFSEPGFAYRAEHVLDADAWYLRTAAHTSSGGFYNARYRIDAQVGLKPGRDRRLVLVGGAHHRNGRDGHRDTGFAAEFQVYALPALIFQGSIRVLHSNPGRVWSQGFDAAVTVGRDRARYVTLRAFHGRESYEVIDPLTIYVDFPSTGARLSWREWISRRGGFHAAASWYENPHYRRIGFEAGVFLHFGS